MDLPNIKGLLSMDTIGTADDNDMDADDNEEDLDEELNAILSGQTYIPKNKQHKQTTSSSAVNTKRVKQMDVKQAKSQRTSRSDHKLSDNPNNEFAVSNDLLNIEKLGIIGDSDEDDSDIDENDEQFLSEIHSIASETKPSERKPQKQTVTTSAPNRSDHKMPQTIGPDNQNLISFATHREKPMNPQIRDDMFKSNSSSTGTGTTDSGTTVHQPIDVNKPKEVDNSDDISKLKALTDDYKKAALLAKKSGQVTTALSHVKTAKQIEVLLKALEEGKAVDLSHLPPPPPSTTLSPSTPQTSSQTTANEETDDPSEDTVVELTTEDAKKFFNAPPPPNTVMEALEQRLAKFKSTLDEANRESNASKARRLGRIVKQYENAIKDFKKGKAMDFEELPTPPGFGPIPPMNSTVKTPDKPSAPINSPSKQQIAPKLVASNVTNKSDNNTDIQAKEAPVKSSPTPPKGTHKPNLKRASSTANKQLNYLLERQRLFKEAALESKQKGDIQQAKEYLRMAKGFEPLIEATQNGLPIDATSIPTPPQMSDDFVIVSHPDSSQVDDLEKEEMFRKIEVELQNQIEMCKRNKDYFMQLGDISTSSKFEKYAVDSRKDLDVLTARWRTGHRVPHFKYETRTFSIVICNTEVTTNEVTVEVVKAVDIPGKADIDTYVRIEFPFPNDNSPSARTKTVKNSVNPVFNETFKFEIDRKSRQLPRTFKRHPLKLELMSKGGFLRSDALIGTALIKLTDFETKCTIHESFALTEGRKAVGGRVEAKVRIREPLLAKQVEEVKEKWLVFV